MGLMTRVCLPRTSSPAPAATAPPKPSHVSTQCRRRTYSILSLLVTLLVADSSHRRGYRLSPRFPRTSQSASSPTSPSSSSPPRLFLPSTSPRTSAFWSDSIFTLSLSTSSLFYYVQASERQAAHPRGKRRIPRQRSRRLWRSCALLHCWCIRVDRLTCPIQPLCVPNVALASTGLPQSVWSARSVVDTPAIFTFDALRHGLVSAV